MHILVLVTKLITVSFRMQEIYFEAIILIMCFPRPDTFSVLDASELVPSGILAGDTHKLGNFEECLKTRVPPELGFSAQYCLPVFNYIPSNFSTGAFASQDEWAKPVWSRIMVSIST